MSGPWEKYATPDVSNQGPWSKYSTPTNNQPEQSEIFSTIQKTISPIFSQVENTPIGLGQKAYGVIQNLFNRAGQKTAESLAQNGVNAAPLFSPSQSMKVSPQIAAGAGTLVQMTPDIITSATMPAEKTFPSNAPKADFIGLQDMGRDVPKEPLFNLREGPSAGSTVSKATLDKMNVQPIGEPNPASTFSTKAQDMGINALGYGKGMLKTPQNIDRARQTAQTMLDEGVITPFASHEKMAERANELADTSGQAIGDYLKSVGTRGKLFDPNKAIESIEELRPRNENGELLTGGLYDKLNSKIDQAVQTIEAHTKNGPLQAAVKLRGKTYVGNPGEIHADIINRMANESGEDPNTLIDSIQKIGDQGFVKNGKFLTRSDVSAMTGERPEAASLLASGTMSKNVSPSASNISFEDANKLKGILQENANWKSNKDATLLDRVIAGKFRQSIDDALANVSNTGTNKTAYADFLANKKIYSAAMQAQDPLYNRISSHLANNGISLTDFILAAPEIAVGNPMRAIGLMGGRRLLQNYGSQMGASLFNSAAKSNLAGNIPGVAEGVVKTLDKNKAQEFLDQAKGDKEKARQLAREAGYSF